MREKTRKINVGGISIGGGSGVVVQSMTNTLTTDVRATVRQIKRLEKAGCELVRCSVPCIESAEAIGEIKKRIAIPIVSDIHFDYKIAMACIDSGTDKIRVNPGNIRKDKILEIAKKARDNNVALRIGVNTGSLQGYHEIKEKDRPKFIVDKVLKYITDFENIGFKNIIVSLKSSDIDTSFLAYKLFSEVSDYPIHVGITESGSLFSGSIKSSAGLAMILKEGIGDTIRVSLTADPVWEVRVAYNLLQVLKIRQKMPEIISCPTCARTSLDVIKLVNDVEKFIYSLDWSKDKEIHLRIAVMGCIVNGPGEAEGADFAICGLGKNKIALYRNGKREKVFEYNKLGEIFYSLFKEELRKKKGRIDKLK